MLKPERAPNIRRIYCPYDVGRLRFLKNCRNLGFPLADAKTLFTLSEGDGGNCQPVKELALLNALSVCSRMDKLGRLEAAFIELAANCVTRNVSRPMLSKLRTIQQNFGLDVVVRYPKEMSTLRANLPLVFFRRTTALGHFATEAKNTSGGEETIAGMERFDVRNWQSRNSSNVIHLKNVHQYYCFLVTPSPLK